MLYRCEEQIIPNRSLRAYKVEAFGKKEGIKADRRAVVKDMRAFFWFRRPWLFLSGFAGVVLVSSIAVHPFGSVKRVNGHGANISDLAVPLEVKALFERSCSNCHSSQTAWPWYSYVAPASWLVERDVRRGRDHMNLSYWPQYSMQQKEKLLANIASVVKNREMPLPQYLLLHREARLSDAELDILYQWARMERRQVKAALASSMPPAEVTIPSVTLRTYSGTDSPQRQGKK